MSGKPNLKLVPGWDSSTGELTCERCREVRVGDLENAEKEVRKLKRRIKVLEEDKDEKRASHKERKKVLAVIELWAELTGHPKANTNAGDRFDYVVARRKEQYSWENIELAIRGLAANPYVTKAGRQPTGKPNQRHDRIGVALGSGENLERFAVLGYRAQKRENRDAAQ